MEKVSRIGLGTWAIGGWMWGGTDEKESIATIRHALDLGINLIDTAPVYGFGVAEEIVGKALKKHGKRDQIIIATKAGLSWENKQKVFRDSRKNTIYREIEDSLKRLQVDYIDLYLIHWPDPLTPFSETADALQHLLKEGKIRAIGVSNFSVEQMEAFKKSGPLHSLQSPYNIFEREIEAKELAYCLKKDIAVLGYGSLCRGLLTGKKTKGTEFKGDDLRKADPKFIEPRYSQYLKCVEHLDAWAKENYDRSILGLALRFALDKGISVALWGARKPHQLEEIKSAWGWKLTKSDFDEIDKILQTLIPLPMGPGFMAPPARQEKQKKVI